VVGAVRVGRSWLCLTPPDLRSPEFVLWMRDPSLVKGYPATTTSYQAAGYGASRCCGVYAANYKEWKDGARFGWKQPMSTIGALSHAIQPLGITAMATRREVTAREFHAQLGEAMQRTLQAIFPTMPERAAYDAARAHIRIALTRADLRELPAALVRPRVVPPGGRRPGRSGGRGSSAQ
jgi:hypothetical protein